MAHSCLNCGTKVNSNFCPNCGQNVKTHRYSIKHFIEHDLIHGIFHLDKGFFFTLKELILRPGHSIREYVQGKRIKHFNFFTFIILIITFNHLLGSFSDVKMMDILSYNSNSKDYVTQFGEFTQKYPKLLTLIQIPVLSLISWGLFKKSNQNYTENLVLNIYKAGAQLIISMFFMLLAIITKNLLDIKYIYMAFSTVSLTYSVRFFYQYFSKFGYSKLGLWIRSIISSVLLMFLISSISAFVVGVKEGFEQAKQGASIDDLKKE